MQGGPDLSHGLAGPKDGGEACESEDGPDEGAGEGHRLRDGLGCTGRYCRFVGIQAYLAQNQADSLAYAGAYPEQHALEGQLQGQPVRILAAGEDGDGYTREGYEHRQPGVPGHRFAQHQPAGNARYRRSQRHEELAVAGAEDYV